VKQSLSNNITYFCIDKHSKCSAVYYRKEINPQTNHLQYFTPFHPDIFTFQHRSRSELAKTGDCNVCNVIILQEAKSVERWPNTTSAWAGWSRFDIPVVHYLPESRPWLMSVICLSTTFSFPSLFSARAHFFGSVYKTNCVLVTIGGHPNR
jgi:hypothetical protein